MPTKPLLTITEHLREITQALQAVGIPTARLDALLLLEYITAKSRTWLLAHPEVPLSAFEAKKLQRLVKRRTQRKPVAYILGKVEFHGLTLEVNRHVLIPRPESEALVELIRHKAHPHSQVLEVGTGSGALAIALGRVRDDLEIIATDLSAEALRVARRNAHKYLMDEISFRKGDLMDDIKDSFDVIIANLPYVPTDRPLEPELAYEPAQALFGGPDGLDIYRRFFQQLPGHLRQGGFVTVEAEPSQHLSLVELAAEQRLKLIDTAGFALLLH